MARVETSSVKSYAAIGAITLLAIALRFYRISDQSAWIDEAFTIHAALQPWDRMLEILVGDFNHPPLHTLLVRLWFEMVGPGVTHARVLSAVFGVLAVPAVYWLGSQLFNRRTGLIGALLLAISQLGIVYSQEARGYSLLLLLVTLTTGLFVKAFRSGRAGDFGVFAVAASAAMYVHYYAAFTLIALGLFAVIYRRQSRIPGVWWVPALLFGLIVYLPWLTSGVVESAMRNPASATVPGLSAQLATPVFAINWFNNGKMDGIRSEAPIWAFAAGFLIFTVAALAAYRTSRDEDPARSRASLTLLTLAAVLPILFATALGLLKVVYDVRHISFAMVPYYLLVARGVTQIAAPLPRYVVVAVMVAYTAVSFRADYFIPYKDNNRDAVALMAVAARTGDCAVFTAADSIGTADMYWSSYYSDRPAPAQFTPEQAAARQDCRRVWLLWDKSWWKRGPGTYERAKATLERRYRPAAAWSFDAIEMQLYER